MSLLKLVVLLQASFEITGDPTLAIKENCLGVWDVKSAYSKEEGYAARHMKYPKTLTVFKDKIVFIDNVGNECTVGHAMDRQMKVLVFANCLPSKHPNQVIVPLHYKIKCDTQNLTGTVHTYKKQFNLKGKRAPSK